MPEAVERVEVAEQDAGLQRIAAFVDMARNGNVHAVYEVAKLLHQRGTFKGLGYQDMRHCLVVWCDGVSRRTVAEGWLEFYESHKDRFKVRQ